jgi:hypothetical protein
MLIMDFTAVMNTVKTAVPEKTALSMGMTAFVLTGFAVIAALAIVVLVVVSVLRNRKVVDYMQELADDAIGALTSAGREDGETPAKAVERAFSSAQDTRIVRFGESLCEASEALYEGRWIVDPTDVYPVHDLFKTHAMQMRTRLYAWLCFAIGSVAIAVFVPLGGLLETGFNSLSIALPLFVIGLVGGLFLLVLNERKTVHEIKECEHRVTVALASFVPVFQDKVGVATLVSEVIGYGEKMREEVRSFSLIAEELTKGEFAEGIKTGVRDVMTEEVVPPLNESNYALTELAKSLAEKQELGMERLADTFSESVAHSLSVHMSALPEKLEVLHRVIDQSAVMMEESNRALEQAKQENMEVNRDVREVLRLMALAKDDMADEMAFISDNLAIIGSSTDKMTALYAGEETNLASHINLMTEQLRIYSEKLDRGIGESAKAIDASVEMSKTQNKQSSILLDRLDAQLLALDELGRLISQNTTHFTRESSEYVLKTLKEFDASLAEVVERLTFTTAEIRDAVDALPPAIRRAGLGQDL